MKLLPIVFVTTAAGCSSMSPIQPAKTSKSGFEGAVYSGQTVDLARNLGVEEFRVFHQGASSFVPIQAVRGSAERRAHGHGARIGKQMIVFQEVTSKAPHILGNFPRVELIFGCVDSPKSVQGAPDDQKYRKIAELKSLLDSGAITD
jgi:hypothetical protein